MDYTQKVGFEILQNPSKTVSFSRRKENKISHEKKHSKTVSFSRKNKKTYRKKRQVFL
jgi:hypothetical protein